MTEKRKTFLELLDRLTKDTPAMIKRDHGSELKQHAGLLQQLREAMFSGMEPGGGSAQFGSRPPIDAGATDLLNEITEQAAQVLAKVSNTPTPYGHAEHYVRLWAAQTTESQIFTITSRATMDNAEAYTDRYPGRPVVYEQDSDYTAYALLARWTDRIEDFFNPPSSKEIPADCPNCGARYVYRMKDGQHIQSAALNIIRDRDTGISIEAKCSSCTRTWPRSQFEFLASLVGATPVPELEGLGSER